MILHHNKRYRKNKILLVDSSLQVETMVEVDFSEYVDVIKDWPEPGKAVCDISRLLEHPNIFHEAVVALAKPLVEVRPNKVIGIEQRGLALGSAVAYYLGCGIVPARSIAFLPEDYEREVEFLPSSKFVDRRLAIVSESMAESSDGEIDVKQLASRTLMVCMREAFRL